ncbi:MAG TPA: fatty acid desaturase [Thermoleophilaceae bacterium]|jgi:fatty acid desaturase
MSPEDTTVTWPASAALVGDEDRLLDGTTEVLLAPVRGRDPRRELPRELFHKRPALFVLKFGFASLLIAASCAVILAGLAWPLQALAVVVLGLMYAHLVELQHETLHEHAFNSRRLNRWFGFVCGLFMFSSYSHYKYDHLRHHADLGTDNNREFFNYRFQNLHRPDGMIRAMWHMGRYADVFRDIVRSIARRPLPGIRERHNKRIQDEYRLFAVAIVAACAFTAITGDFVLLLLWLLPLLAIAEPTHFLIELPEHFGLNTQSNPDVLSNTRTVAAGPLLRWFTNSNNLHTAHHYHQGVPMVNVPELHGLIDHQVRAAEDSYWSFFAKVATGKLRYEDMGATCMTR